MNRLFNYFNKFQFIISVKHTTRKQRNDEKDKYDYNFVSENEFEQDLSLVSTLKFKIEIFILNRDFFMIIWLDPSQKIQDQDEIMKKSRFF